MAHEAPIVAPLPAHVARLFLDDAAASVLDPGYRSYLVGHLLATGDRRDLAWLFGRVDEHEVAELTRREGYRRLDRRNRAFWSWVLGVPVPERSAPSWPLG